MTAPTTPPAEVEALKAENARLQEMLALPEHVAAQRIPHLQTSMKFLAGIARSFGFANQKQEMNEQFIGRGLREQAARVAEVEAALREIATAKTWMGEHGAFGAGHDAAREWAQDIARAALKGKP